MHNFSVLLDLLPIESAPPRLDALPLARHHGCMIYKIFKLSEWDDFESNGETKGAPIDLQDGFIHFSTAKQVAETAALHFAGQENLILVSVNDATLGDALKWEESRGGALFPHLFRSLTSADVVSVHRIGYENGVHIFPEGLE